MVREVYSSPTYIVDFKRKMNAVYYTGKEELQLLALKKQLQQLHKCAMKIPSLLINQYLINSFIFSEWSVLNL